jgi:hypothetical protein
MVSFSVISHLIIAFWASIKLTLLFLAAFLAFRFCLWFLIDIYSSSVTGSFSISNVFSLLSNFLYAPNLSKESPFVVPSAGIVCPL